MTARGRTVASALAVAVVPVVVLVPTVAIVGAADRYNARRLLEMAWAALLVASMLHPSLRAGAWRRWRALAPLTRGAVGAFVAWSAVSAILSVAPAYALREWALGTLVLVALLPLSELWRGQEEPVRLTVAVTLLLHGVLTVVQPEVHGFAHPRFQGQFLAITAPVLLFAGDFTLALFAAPALAGGILNGSRALMATLVGIVIVALVPWTERRRRVLPALAALGVAVALVVGSGLLTGVSEELSAAAVRGTSDTGRLVTWAEVLRLAAQHPFLGLGPGLTALEPGLLRWAGHPHNVTLTVLGEVGGVGLLLAGLILVQFVRMGLAAPPRLQPWVLAVVAALGHGQLSGTFIMPGAQVALAVVAGVILAETAPKRAEGEEADEAGARGRGWILAGLGLAAVAILVATLDLPMSRPASEATWAPRFWIPGVIPR